ncbi:helix-turn-helix domain-containing protein [Halegenticoccus tardaugens]|uniref:helix-turn-helix domain-containing protein n=1 Tax=Halegenticoccus tardaugens TaxID=2071624 RepID=UPI00100BD9FC|nr:helix-turn-helix domain-containing protein [Halegenticoccus tardaugens]
MKYFTVTLLPDAGGVHPVDRMLASRSDVEREALLHVNAFNDGTGVMVYRIRGRYRAIADALDAHEELVSSDLLYEENDAFHLYVHLRPGEPAGSLMMLFQRYALMVDTPIAFTERDGLRTTLIGSHEMLRRAVAEMPDSVSISVEGVGRYVPDDLHIRSRLTTRQLEVVETAVEMGYYAVPRRTTHEEIARRLGCAPSTVNEHLRKAESRVLSQLRR